MVEQTILHIGGEKTGTTTLQRFLRQNAQLLEKFDVHYPCDKNNLCFENNAHFPIAACLIDGEVDFVSEARQLSASRIFSALTQSCLSARKTLLLSCEHFSSRLSQHRQLHALRNALPTENIKIVFYAREPSELALAAWSTGVRHGSPHRLDLDAVHPDNPYFNHLMTLDLWADVFGKENLIVREYDRALLFRQDIRHDFCKALGLEVGDYEDKTDQNLSLDGRLLEILRQINCRLPSFEESATEWRKAEKIRSLICRYAPAEAPIKRMLSSQEAKIIKDRFKETHQTLNERYFHGGLSANWFTTSLADDEAATTKSAEISQAELLQLMSNMIIHLAASHYEVSGSGHSRRERSMRKKIGKLINAVKTWSTVYLRSTSSVQ